MDNRKIGARIKQARKERGLTQAQLAELLDITPKYLSNFETGERLPRFETFIDIANVLNYSADALLCDVLEAPAAGGSCSITERLNALPSEDRRRIMRTIDFLITDARSNPAI